MANPFDISKILKYRMITQWVKISFFKTKLFSSGQKMMCGSTGSIKRSSFLREITYEYDIDCLQMI